MFESRSRATTLTLASLVALGPMSTDMYLPALPRIGKELAATPAEVQLTLSLFLAGFALAQLIYGPLADRFGRKPAMLGGMVLFVVATLGCTFSENIYSLMLFRLLQALGGCAGPVLGRAIVRDIYGPSEAGKVLSYIGSLMAIAPAIAPALGGVMTVHLGWVSIFWFLMCYGIAAAWLFSSKVVETAPVEHRHPKSVARILKDFGELLQDRRYLGFTLACAFSYAGLFAFLSGSSFVLIEHFGVGEQMFGFLFLLVVLGYISGTLISARLSHSHGIHVLVRAGTLILLAGGTLMLLLSWMQSGGAATVVIPMMLFMVGVGMVMPQSMAGALQHYPHMAGTASGLLGFIQMTLAGLAGVVVGHAYNESALPMAAMIAATGLMALLSYQFMVALAPLPEEKVIR